MAKFIFYHLDDPGTIIEGPTEMSDCNTTEEAFNTRYGSAMGSRAIACSKEEDYLTANPKAVDVLSGAAAPSDPASLAQTPPAPSAQAAATAAVPPQPAADTAQPAADTAQPAAPGPAVAVPGA